jgi:hypothetical protein
MDPNIGKATGRRGPHRKRFLEVQAEIRAHMARDKNTLRYCDGMKGGTLALLYNLILQLDTHYSNPIEGLDETIRTKLHNVFMSRWSDFHAPVHSAAFAMDRQFCRRDIDASIKKDIWSVMEDFAKAPGGKDFSKMKAQYHMFVDAVGSKQVTV